MRSTWLGLALAGLGLGCRPAGASTTSDPPRATSQATEPTAARPTPRGDLRPASSLQARLQAHAVTEGDFVRLDLYTWTTPEQIEALRGGGPLLVADAYSAGHTSPFNRRLLAMIDQRLPGHEIARLLHTHPALTKRRYAWPSPFATVLGRGPRRYGEALIRVQLDRDSVIAVLDPGRSAGADEPPASPWRFVDAQGQAVSAAAVLAAPERLAAVYHLQAPSEDGVPFREYVLCNEARVARWSVGTAAIARRVAQERQLVLDLAAGPFAVPSSQAVRWRAAPQWRDEGPAPTLASQWHRTLAFDNERYRPTPEGLTAIARALADYEPTPPQIIGGTSTHSPPAAD